MYNPQRFKETNFEESFNVMVKNPFATVTSIAEGKPFVSHLPLIPKKSGDKIELIGHLARTNPHWKLLSDGPLSTLIVLAFSKIQNGDSGNSVLLAKSIFVAVPSTLLFFIPFLLADKFKLSFWTAYCFGFCLLSVSFFAHKIIMATWMRQ